mmetsp:Transcript_13774/g.39660  ORF Transcript_13774/g.39660 Transcript_13774/m.39660 type:complete len:144 (-) Transcript_13774:29-460(-)
MGNACCNAKDTDKHDSVEAPPRDIPGTSLDFGAGQDKLPPAATDGDVFYINIDKSAGAKLGIDVDPSDGVTLLVDEVTGGLVGDWNQAHPDMKVMKGDRVVEVNGHKGDVSLLVAECKQDQKMSMGVKKCSPERALTDAPPDA